MHVAATLPVPPLLGFAAWGAMKTIPGRRQSVSIIPATEVAGVVSSATLVGKHSSMSHQYLVIAPLVECLEISEAHLP